MAERRKAVAATWRGWLLALPVLGPLLRFLNALRHLTAFRAETGQQLALLEQRTAGLETRAAALEARSDGLELRSDGLELRSAALEARAASLEKRTDALEPRSAALEAATATLAAHAQALEAQAASIELRFTGQQQTTDNQRLDTSALQAYVTALHADMEALGALTRRTAADQAALAQGLGGRFHADSSAGLPDKIFLEMERRLVATNADLKARQALYLEHFGDSFRDLPVLDVGCGSGEWLAYLNAHGIAARGAELNEAMVEKCLAQGLAVSHDDGLAVLRAQAAASLRAVTALQVVERLSVGTLWQWLAAARQALAPGGRLIIETLNPENPQVAAYTFHLARQPLAPLPPPLLTFLVCAAGFEIVALLGYDPAPEEPATASPTLHALPGGGNEYAIVASRPEHD